ncbi:MAG: preprotein translocase subunit SecE [Dehalococcoidia bacterium]|nr:preprotein translocase subunit SecE [Dehalococcoidia bacterium]
MVRQPSRAGLPGNAATQRAFRSGFVGDIINELRKVEWPTWQQIYRLSVIVIAISVAIGIALGLVDLGFTYLSNKLLLGG